MWAFIKKCGVAYADSVLSDLKWYREWRGGVWHFIDTGGDYPAKVWSRHPAGFEETDIKTEDYTKPVSKPQLA